jgi:hypothetical protein
MPMNLAPNAMKQKSATKIFVMPPTIHAPDAVIPKSVTWANVQMLPRHAFPHAKVQISASKANANLVPHLAAMHAAKKAPHAIGSNKSAIPSAITISRDVIPFAAKTTLFATPNSGIAPPFAEKQKRAVTIQSMAFPTAVTPIKSAKTADVKKIAKAVSDATKFAVPSAMSAKKIRAKSHVMPPHIRAAAKMRNSAVITPQNFVFTAHVCRAAKPAKPQMTAHLKNSAMNRQKHVC